MYIGIFSRHTEIYKEEDDLDWLVSVEDFLYDGYPHLRHLFRYFSQYRGVAFGRAIAQSVLLGVQHVLNSDFCRL